MLTDILIRARCCREPCEECISFLLLVTSLCCQQKTEAVAGRSVDNVHGKTGAVQLDRAGSDKKACGHATLTEDQEYIKEIKELHAYLDMVSFCSL